jgi:CBS domain-containing protein
MTSTMPKTDELLCLHAQVAADLMMPDPISIRAEASASEALTLFTEKAITAAPVIDPAGRPIGVISRSDLLVHRAEHEKHFAGKPAYFFAPSFEPDSELGATRTAGTTTVADLMTPAVFAVSPDTPMSRVVGDMVGLHVHRLFVVDEDGVLVGVITTMDVLKHLKSDN